MKISRPSWFTGNLPWLFSARAMRSFSQASLVVAVPLYIAAAGYTTLQVGYLLSIAMLGSIVMTLLVGFLSDRFGRKSLLIAIAAMGTIGAAIYSLTTQFWVLALMSALASIRGGGAGSGGGFGPFYPAEQALIAGSCADKHRNTVFSSLSMVGVLAGAAGSAIAVLPGILQSNFQVGAVDSFRPIFWIAALGGALVILFTMPIHEKLAVHADRPVIHAERTGRKSPAVSTWKLIGRLWLTNGVNGLVIGVLGPFLTYWLALRYGVGSTEIATLYVIINLVTVISFLLAPRIASALGSVKTIVLARLGSVLLMAGLALAPTFFLAAVAFGLRVIVNSIARPIRQSFVMGIADEKSRSTVAALGSLPSRAVGIVSPTLASYLVQTVSEEAPIWLAVGAVAINAGLFGLLFKDIKPPEEQP